MGIITGAHLARAKDESPITHVERGVDKIERFLRDHQHPELAEENAEVSVLKEWLKELRLKQPSAPVTPPSPIDQMKKEMEKAVRAEQYERAAELRDAIKAMESKR